MSIISNTMKNLTEFEIGESGIVSESSDICECLSSRGIYTGVEIKLVRKAPFSDELYCIQVSDTCLCISENYSEKIFLD
jgi:Fe2+ transport system protein FeoA